MTFIGASFIHLYLVGKRLMIEKEIIFQNKIHVIIFMNVLISLLKPHELFWSSDTSPVQKYPKIKPCA
jgi:hypothetical protein